MFIHVIYRTILIEADIYLNGNAWSWKKFQTKVVGYKGGHPIVTLNLISTQGQRSFAGQL